MEARFETPTRQRWAEILAQHQIEEETEYRRDDARRLVEYGSVRVIFQEWGSWVARSGTLLNASEGGLMAMVKDRVPSALQVQLEVTVRDETFALSGRVAHCTQTVGGFKIGFTLEFAQKPAQSEPAKSQPKQSPSPQSPPTRSQPKQSRSANQTDASKVAAEAARVRRLIRQRRF